MNALSAEHITKRYADHTLLDAVTFGMMMGQKIALVGKNGCGKSTLLRILAGAEQPDSGNVVTQDGLSLAFLPQQPQLDAGDTILEAAMDADDPVLQLVRRYQHAMIRSQSDAGAAAELMELSNEMDARQAWNLEAEVREVLGKLGLHDSERKVAELSGGMQKRIGLARAILRHPDILLLDEPTNHLDIDAIEWLEKYLSRANVTLVMVTHDRYFLENITSDILEIHEGSIYRYEGSYSSFLEKKAAREEGEAASQARARNLMRKELEWIRRQPKARGTKAKYRIDAFEQLKEQATAGSQADNLALDVHARRLGGNILEMKEVTKSYGRTLILPDFSYTFKKGERIGLAGMNGSGKTTFLNLVTGALQPDSGDVTPGVNTHFGYYRQQEPDFTQGVRVIDIVRERADVVQLSDGSSVSASQLLQRFNFSPQKQYDIVDKLSGGEKRRLQLLLVLISNPNFLILDEPTNDLDIYTLQVLEDFLLSFAGCLMIVSHDRYFMDRLVDQLFVFHKGSQVEFYNGSYSAFRLAEAEKQQEEAKPAAVRKPAREKASPSNRLSFSEKREMEQLEKDIDSITASRSDLLARLNSGQLDHQELHSLSGELEKLIAEQDEKEMRWLELSEKEG